MSEYKALYRKWRPVDFDDVSGQKSITDILKYEVSADRLSHAYLFCGSRGTGKTSCAKILAKAVNCLSPVNGNPCNKCEACRSINAGIATDVIEMDAASNNGVGDVRSLKDEINFTPAELKYRVYIIDEVHMMSGAAFNALLKTLEEPPAYVIFILATTEFHKLPTTIVSRCQRFDFKRLSSDDIIDRLTKISGEEGIDLRHDGARLIARASRGGMRDAISLLELCAGSRVPIDASLVSSTVGSGDRDIAYKMIGSLCKSDHSSVYSIIQDVVMSSADISVFWQELIDAYRDVMVVKTSKMAKSYLDLTDVEYEAVTAIAEKFTMSRLYYHTSVLESAVQDMQRAQNSKRSIAEIALTKMCDPKLSASADALLARIEDLEKQLAMIKLGVPAAITDDAVIEVEKTTVAIDREKEQEQKIPEVNAGAVLYDGWENIKSRIAEIKGSLAAQFRGAELYKEGNVFTVKMPPFFAKRLAASRSDYALLLGAIAESEGVSREKVTLRIDGIAERDTPYDSDLEALL